MAVKAIRECHIEKSYAADNQKTTRILFHRRIKFSTERQVDVGLQLYLVRIVILEIDWLLYAVEAAPCTIEDGGKRGEFMSR